MIFRWANDGWTMNGRRRSDIGQRDFENKQVHSIKERDIVLKLDAEELN